ncbi:MAG: AAA family ATPase [Gemmatimonadaceae bacterium]
MYIRSLTVNNWMIHRATSAELFPVTVFVGPNNGGKSALFDALLNFSMVSRGRLSQAFGQGPYSFTSRRHRGAATSARIGYTVEISESKDTADFLTYHITYRQQRGTADAARYSIYDETLVDSSGGTLFHRGEEVYGIKGIAPFINDDTSIFAAIRHAQVQDKYKEGNPLVSHCAREISRINKFRLDPSTLARPSRLPDTITDELQETRPPRLDYSGDGLAGILYFLAETANPMIDVVAAELAEAIDGFDGFEFNTVGADRIGFSARFDDSRGIVPAANLSDGTLSLIGLLVLLMNPDRPPVLCLEEPENGLTPRATRAVYEAIVNASEATDPEVPSQVLISSHSPFVICAAWNGDEREFIYQVKPEGGRSLIRPFAQIIEEQGIHPGKVHGKREHLSLNVADQVMAGYYS